MGSVEVGLRLLEYVNELKRLPRTGWLYAGVRLPESVADHIAATGLLATVLAEYINADYSAQGLSVPLKLGHVARIALVHDLAESLTTDLPLRTQQLLTAAVKYDAEQRALEQIFADFPNRAEYVGLWAEYQAGSSAEARVVRDADKLEIAHQALCYERVGHRNLDEFWQGHSWNYPMSNVFFEQMLAARPG